MSDLKIFEAARLAEASYALYLNSADSKDDYVKKLSKFIDGSSDNYSGPFSHSESIGGLGTTSQSEAQRFADDYDVVHQSGPDENGFSATVFQSVVSGELTIATRGTEGLNLADWQTNLGDIGADGIALKQATSLFNYYQRLVAPEGEPALQLVFHEQEPLVENAIHEKFVKFDLEANLQTDRVRLYNYFTVAEPNVDSVGLGKIPSGSSFNVVGHSLGGHLAMVMSRLDPARVNEIYSFNGPFFDGNPLVVQETEWFFDGIADAQGDSTTVGEFPVDKIQTIRANGDIVSLSGLNRPGDIAVQFLESNNAYGSHLISNQGAALEVYRLYGFLVGQVDYEETYSILEDMSDKGELLKNAQALADLLGANKIDSTLDEPLYRQLDAIVQHVTGGTGYAGALVAPYDGLQITPLDTELPFWASNQNDIAFRYALVNGLSFVLSGTNDSQLYSQHNANGELELASADFPDGLSESYIRDRVDFMRELLIANNKDFETTIEATDSEGNQVQFVEGNRTLGENGDYVYFGSTEGDYSDASGETTDARLYGGAGGDILIGSGAHDRLEGNSDNDSLVGGQGSDELHGGSGDDALFGGEINAGDSDVDHLHGGTGHDTYLAGNGDIINDTDGLGRIQFVLADGSKAHLLGGTREDGDPENQWTSDDGAVVYQLAGTNLTVSTAGQSLLIEDVTLDENGAYLGMQFDGNPVVVDPPNNNFVVNTLSPPVWDNTTPYEEHLAIHGDYQGYPAFTHPDTGVSNETGVVWASHGAYVGETESERIVLDDVQMSGNVGSLSTGVYAGGAGNSIMIGSPSHDLLLDHYQAVYWWDAYNPMQAEDSGRGRVDNVNDTDKLYGGDGRDVLMATEGNDYLYGGDGDDILTEWSLFADSDLSAWVAADEGNSNRDEMYGEEGDDYLYAHADANKLDGGAGDDHLYAGEGDDRLIGGAGDDALYGDVYRKHVSQANVDVTTGATVNGTNTNDVVNYGRDILNGGAGADNLFGTGGKDDLLGGSDNDWLFGDETAGAFDLAAQTHASDNLFGEGGNDNLYGNGGADFMAGGDGDDTLIGDSSSSAAAGVLDGAYHGGDTMHGGAGMDTLIGDGGSDYLTGDTGNDTLVGDDYPQAGVAELAAQYQGDDTLDGGAGDDGLAGGLGADTLIGGAGSDTLYGDAFVQTSKADNHGNDTLSGGTGNDYLFGHGGDDQYNFFIGDGDDIVFDSGGSNDTLLYAAANSDELVLLNDAGNLVLSSSSDAADGDKVSIGDYFNSDSIELIELSDGTVLDTDAVGKQLLYVRGSDEDDVIRGNNQDNIIEGLAGNDTFYGSGGDDEINGGDGVDEIIYSGIGENYTVETTTDTQGGEVLVVTDIFTGNDVDYLYGIENVVFQSPEDKLDPVTGNEFSGGNEDEAFVFTPVFSSANGGTAANALDFSSVWDPDGGSVRLSGFEEIITDSGTNNSVVSIGENGEVTITPIDNFQGTISYTYSVVDNQGGTSNGTFEYEVKNINDAPVVVNRIDNVQLEIGEDVSFTIPFDTFYDVDNNIVSINATVYSSASNQDSSWLVYDAETLSFSGVCPPDGAGNLYVEVKATDAYGDSASTYFSVDVGFSPEANSDVLFVQDVNSQYFSFDALTANDEDPDGYALTMDEIGEAGGLTVRQSEQGFTVAQRSSDEGGWKEAGRYRFYYTIEDAQGFGASASAYVVFVPPGLDAISGSDGADELAGIANTSNFIEAGAGADTVIGGSLNDVLHGNDGNDIVEGGDGWDTLRGNRGDDYLAGGAGWDKLFGGAGEDELHGGNGSGSNDLHGGSGNDKLFGGSEDGGLFGGSGDDLLDAEQGSADLYGGAGADELIGGDGNTTLNGGGGNDVITSSADASHTTLIGGAGDDILNGHGDNDIAKFLGPIENYQIIGEGAKISIIDLVGDGGTDTLHNIESLDFGQSPVSTALFGHADAFYATAGSVVVLDSSELLANDTRRLFGNDTFETVEDTLASVQDAENGSVSLSYTGEVLFVPDEGITGEAGFSYSLENGRKVDVGIWFDSPNQAPEAVFDLENVELNAGEPLLFSLPNYVFVDADGDDLSIALATEIRVDGVLHDELPSWLMFDADALMLSGTAPIQSTHVEVSFVAIDPEGLSASTTLDIVVQGENTEDQTLIGTDASDSIIGGQGNDEIRGLQGRDMLHGGKGNDEIVGGSGKDKLWGNRGADRLFGDRGADTLKGGRGADQLYGGKGADTLKGGRGSDQLYGDNGGDQLKGGRGSDHLTGGRGNDVLAGGLGSDVYHFSAGDGDDVVKLNAGNDAFAFEGDIAVQSLLFNQKGDDLLVSYAENDVITVENWFTETENQIGEITDADGGSLSNAQINLMVDAVAIFNSDAIESSALSTGDQETVILLAA